MNDKEELVGGLDYINKRLKVLYPNKDSDSFIRGLSALYSGIYLDVYVACFSKKSDCLSQWRGYGKYAIKFSAKNLSDNFKILNSEEVEISREYFHFSMRDCIYSAKEKDEAIVKAYESFLESGGGFSLTTNYDLLVDVLSFKNDGFVEESEVRFVLVSKKADMNFQSFRVRGNSLVPYCVVGFNIDAIEKIMIGPMRDQGLAYFSIEKLLARELHDNFYEPKIIRNLVSNSSIPYRD